MNETARPRRIAEQRAAILHAVEQGRVLQRDDDQARLEVYLERVEAAEAALRRALALMPTIPVVLSHDATKGIVEALWSLGEIPGDLGGFTTRRRAYSTCGQPCEQIAENPELPTQSDPDQAVFHIVNILSTSKPHEVVGHN